MKDDAHLVLMGIPLPSTGVLAHVSFCGAGSIIVFNFWTKYGRVVLIKSTRPDAPFFQSVVDVWFRDPRVPYAVGLAIANVFFHAFSEDEEIWDNKTWVQPPLRVAGDGPIGRIRGWHKQFFSENSRLKAAKACGHGFDW